MHHLHSNLGGPTKSFSWVLFKSFLWVFFVSLRGGVEDTRLEAKTQKNPRPRTAFPRTEPLEAKDRNARGQGHKRKCSPKKKRSSQKFFRRSPKKKRSSQKFFRQSPQKNVFQKIIQALHKILTIQKIVLSSSRGQANFRGLEAKAKDFKMCPRGQGRPRGLHLWFLCARCCFSFSISFLSGVLVNILVDPFFLLVLVYIISGDFGRGKISLIGVCGDKLEEHG